MLTIPNLLSLSRLPLALLFLKSDLFYRSLALVLAMLSDGLDGYFARRYNQSSKVGTLLDPLMDRFFVFFVIGVFLSESQITFPQATTLLCRDFSVILFGLYLVFTGRLSTYRFRAIWCGKMTTFMQFLFFLGITLHYTIPTYFFALFILVGILALIELYLSKEERKPSQASNISK